DAAGRVGEVVAVWAESGKSRRRQGRPGTVEGACRWIPWGLQHRQAPDTALPPGGDGAGYVGRAPARARREGTVEGTGGGVETGSGACGGEPHRVLPRGQFGERVSSGVQEGVGAGCGLGGQPVQREWVGGAGRRGIGGRSAWLRWGRRGFGKGRALLARDSRCRGDAGVLGVTG